jgi:hypothetical protein
MITLSATAANCGTAILPTYCGLAVVIAPNAGKSHPVPAIVFGPVGAGVSSTANSLAAGLPNRDRNRLPVLRTLSGRRHHIFS